MHHIVSHFKHFWRCRLYALLVSMYPSEVAPGSLLQKRFSEGFRSATLLKNRLEGRWFPASFAKNFKNNFFTEQLWTAASEACVLPSINLFPCFYSWVTFSFIFAYHAFLTSWLFPRMWLVLSFSICLSCSPETDKYKTLHKKLVNLIFIYLS